MYLNQFSVRILQGQEISGGYVELVHGTQYTVMLRNDRALRCDARVEIDGKDIGTFRLQAHTSQTLERPPHDPGRFTFYRLGSPEAAQAQLHDDPNLGLVRVTFTPELPQTVHEPADEIALASPGEIVSRSAGGTGLSGTSGQQFTSVGPLTLDYSQQTVIHLRLVAKDDSTPRPLTSFSSPVPPRIG